MLWKFDPDCQPHWEAQSALGANDDTLYWRISVCDDGSFSLDESDIRLYGNVPTFRSLSQAKVYALGVEGERLSNRQSPAGEES